MELIIRYYRIRQGLTVKQLANSTGYTPGYINMLENNSRNPSLGTLEIIGSHLEICPKFLIVNCLSIRCDTCCYNPKNRFLFLE
ncbi:helix-turn-helix domain-containing protein [Clostridium kluyveri]|uniref:Transcriptional regulator n=1 Tax=Clostridium kluyveri (strain ATCC 8527 / DSM 555 / NBRC 12016 / NCIMB 10680 / K1) TaxID=431943 RepID=A5F9M4_CLOK5|nr:helix-turn-helix transcriptional regulator [Clostridium kluyveri]ABQ23631.1 transcriptional regulator [Clostridium kluyveri DSM 555]